MSWQSKLCSCPVKGKEIANIIIIINIPAIMIFMIYLSQWSRLPTIIIINTIKIEKVQS